MRNSENRSWALKTVLKTLLAAPVAYTAGILCAAGLLLIVFAVTKPFGSNTCSTNPLLDTITIEGQGSRVEAEAAVQEADKVRGLSGRDCLGEGKGMLFSYDLPGDYCFWMKDMKFSIDMIWLDEEKKIVSIADSVSPGSYPREFCPDRPAQFILEIKAGAAQRYNWQRGTTLHF